MNNSPPETLPPNGNGRGAGSRPGSRPRPRRLKRIDDYLRESLADPDSLAANVGAISSDMMKIEYRLAKAVAVALARSPVPLDEFATLLPAIETCSQLTRQIFRLADLGYRLRGGRTRQPLNSPQAAPSEAADGSVDRPGEESGS